MRYTIVHNWKDDKHTPAIVCDSGYERLSRRGPAATNFYAHVYVHRWFNRLIRWQRTAEHRALRANGR